MATSASKHFTVPHLLTLGEAAEALGVGQRTLREWIDDRRLTVTRLGPRTVRISGDDLLAFIEAARESGQE
jgi:excisionase family DNA binding protein